MSLSVVLTDIEGFFKKVVAGGGSASAAPSATAATQLTQAAGSLNAARVAAEAAIPAAAEVAVNYILALLPGGAAYDIIFDAFVTAVIVQLQAKQKT